MDDRELIAAIDSQVSLALGADTDRLSQQRSDAMEYYLGEPYGNEQRDRSQVVTREVMDTIEWVKPELMKLFASGGETVRFEPQGPQDVELAQQATDYINYLFHRKNPGFRILYEWINDGLLQKNGIVKVWYDDSKARAREEYKGLTETELMALASRDDIEVIEQNSYDSPQALQEREQQVQQGRQMLAQAPTPEAQMQIGMQLEGLAARPVAQLYDVVVHREGAQSGLTIENIPPEEFLISKHAKCIQSSPFCAHRRQITISELREQGYDVPDDLASNDGGSSFTPERIARHSYDHTEITDYDEHGPDESMRPVWITEAYIKTDYDEDGIAELRRVVKVGDHVFENDEVDCMPFAGWTPIIISHKFHGLSMADLVMDLQRIQSQLFRNLLDNQYLANNGRYVAVENMVNLDDLMSSRPHGVIRAKMLNAVARLDTPQLGATAFQMLGYVDQLREKRTGVSERTQGLDQGQLGANQAATAVNQVMTAAQQRIELIARVFGETGLTDLFRLMYKLVIQNQTSRDIFRLRDRYVEVDPSEWRERKDTTVVVGLGNGSREQEMLQLNMIFQNQMQLLANPSTATIVSPQNIYNTLEDQVKVFNKASSGRHFTDPQSPEAQQRAAQQAQQQAQQQQQLMAMQQQQLALEQAKIQVQQLKAQNDNANKQAEINIKQQAQRLDEREHEDDVALRTAELAMEAELERDQKRGVELG
jgi:hypothetical protein